MVGRNLRAIPADYFDTMMDLRRMLHAYDTDRRTPHPADGKPWSCGDCQETRRHFHHGQTLVFDNPSPHPDGLREALERAVELLEENYPHLDSPGRGPCCNMVTNDRHKGCDCGRDEDIAKLRATISATPATQAATVNERIEALEKEREEFRSQHRIDQDRIAGLIAMVRESDSLRAEAVNKMEVDQSAATGLSEEEKEAMTECADCSCPNDWCKKLRTLQSLVRRLLGE